MTHEIAPGYTTCTGCHRLLRTADGPTCPDCVPTVPQNPAGGFAIPLAQPQPEPPATTAEPTETVSA